MKTFKIRIDNKNPAHITFTVFAGNFNQTLANCGRLAMRVDEYQHFENILHAGAAKADSLVKIEEL